jgi:hypothetical protein
VVKRDPCVDKTDLCVDKTDLCVDKTDLCVDKRDLCVDKRDLCVDKTDLCVDKTDLCVDKRGHDEFLLSNICDRPFTLTGHGARLFDRLVEGGAYASLGNAATVCCTQ